MDFDSGFPKWRASVCKLDRTSLATRASSEVQLGGVRVYGGSDLAPLVVLAVVRAPCVLQRQFRVRMGSDLGTGEPAMCGRLIEL